MPLPGAVARALHGRLCLDDLPEYRQHVLAVLRQPLRRVLQEYNLTHDVDFALLAPVAAQVLTPEGSRDTR